MSKTLRRLLLLLMAAVAMLSMQAMPAHADANVNFQTVWDNNECLRPDLYWPPGQSVHEYSCSDGLAHHWLTSGGLTQWSSVQIWWAPNSACLVPNWDRLGSPVVVTKGGNVCNNNDAYWEIYPTDQSGYYEIRNIATGLFLDYDDSGAGRGLQLWKELGDSNQRFYIG